MRVITHLWAGGQGCWPCLKLCGWAEGGLCLCSVRVWASEMGTVSTVCRCLRGSLRSELCPATWGGRFHA